jgi:hypothetical protein
LFFGCPFFSFFLFFFGSHLSIELSFTPLHGPLTSHPRNPKHNGTACRTILLALFLKGGIHRRRMKKKRFHSCYVPSLTFQTPIPSPTSFYLTFCVHFQNRKENTKARKRITWDGRLSSSKPRLESRLQGKPRRLLKPSGKRNMDTHLHLHLHLHLQPRARQNRNRIL